MSLTRKCSRTACPNAAVATLTYVYSDSTVVVGPLATYAEPHTYDLCADHAERLTAPRGWEVVRLSGDYSPPEPTPDDLLALANAVREAGRPRQPEPPAPLASVPPQRYSGAHPAPLQPGVPHRDGTARRGHLRALPDDQEG